MEDAKRLELLVRLERERLKQTGVMRYLIDIERVADAAGISPQEVLELYTDITSEEPTSPVQLFGSGSLPHPRTHIALLRGPDVRPFEDIEAEVIRFAIAYYRGQMSEVARRLRIGRSTLYRKIEELGTRAEEPDVTPFFTAPL